MTDEGAVAAREAALWSLPGTGSSVWAVLDPARNPAVYRALIESRLEFLCLYSGRLSRELEMAAPQLVELLPGHRLTRRLLGEGWGDGWGIFLRIADPSNLRHHLRKFLRVGIEGRSGHLLLRYYDPRVLGAFLRSCDAGQLREFVGPIESLACETAGGAAMAAFGLRNGVLHERTVWST